MDGGMDGIGNMDRWMDGWTEGERIEQEYMEG